MSSLMPMPVNGHSEEDIVASSSINTAGKRTIMIVAGEASGDMYGAELVAGMREVDQNLRFIGIGGERMREAGVTTLVDSADMAVVGLIEVVKHFDVISAAFLKLKRILRSTPPALLILIDYPGFNLRLAHIAKKAGVKVLYYISPQIWAWRRGRVHKIARLVDHMAVILPFEVPFYQQAEVPVTFVGHPLIDMVAVEKKRDDASTSFGLDPSRKIVGLFPGSRRNEIERLLPSIGESAILLRERHPGIQFVLPLASTLSESEIRSHPVLTHLSVTIVKERIHDLIRACDAIICASGTVTLEIALVGTPMVIIYKLSPLTYFLARYLVKVANIGLCNIVAGKTVVKELIQDEANPQAIAAEIDTILNNTSYNDDLRKQLANVRQKLGNGGASANLARLAFSIMEP